MKKLSILLTAILCTTFTKTNAQSSFFLEQQNIYNSKSNSWTHSGFIWAAAPLTKHWGIFSFATASKNWGEFYAGPNYVGKIKKGIVEIGSGIGFETSKNDGLRSGSYIFLQTKRDSTQNVKGKTQMMAFFEHGPSGPWYLGFYTRGITKHFSIGVQSQRFSSTGPRLQLDFAKKLMIYVVPGMNIESKEKTVHFGLRAYF